MRTHLPYGTPDHTLVLDVWEFQLGIVFSALTLTFANLPLTQKNAGSLGEEPSPTVAAMLFFAAQFMSDFRTLS
jgi:hypothetical protein